MASTWGIVLTPHLQPPPLVQPSKQILLTRGEGHPLGSPPGGILHRRWCRFSGHISSPPSAFFFCNFSLQTAVVGGRSTPTPRQAFPSLPVASGPGRICPTGAFSAPGVAPKVADVGGSPPVPLLPPIASTAVRPPPPITPRGRCGPKAPPAPPR